MPHAPKGPTPELYVVPRHADNEGMKTAEAGGSDDFASIAIEIAQRWGADSRLSGDLARDLTPQRTHTIDHINCPSCEAYDRFVKSDLLGMAGQRFIDAARVWSSAQRKSGKLRPRTLESLGEYLRALNKFFRDIRMSSNQSTHAEGLSASAPLQCDGGKRPDSSSMAKDGQPFADLS